MVYRKTFKKKRFAKNRYRGAIGIRRRVARGGMLLSARMKYKNPTHYFKRATGIGNIANFTAVSSATNGNQLVKTADGYYIDTGAAGSTNVTYYSCSLYLTLDMLPDYGEFQTLFDRYMIVGAKLNLMPFGTGVNQESFNVTGQQGTGAMVYSVVDYDDATTFSPSDTGVQLMRQYESFKQTNFFRGGYQRYIKPRLAISAYGAGAFTSYANVRPLWIDMNSPSVQHYGFKFVLEAFAPNPSQHSFIWFRPVLTIYLKCKDLR